jgi:CRP-like cAMP-binding protein
MEHLGTLVRCEVDDTVYHCTEQALYWYRIMAGAARKCALAADGRRQIVDFMLPGDLFGFGANNVHHFSAEVITPGTIITRYPRRRAEQLAESDPQVSRWIREAAFESISRLQARTLILGRTSALARVSAFLLEWADRGCELSGTAISLPMSRYDIADYLAMAVETVSRAFTALRTRRVIAFSGTRRLSICDRHALALATEGADDEVAVAN